MCKHFYFYYNFIFASNSFGPFYSLSEFFVCLFFCLCVYVKMHLNCVQFIFKLDCYTKVKLVSHCLVEGNYSGVFIFIFVGKKYFCL